MFKTEKFKIENHVSLSKRPGGMIKAPKRGGTKEAPKRGRFGPLNGDDGIYLHIMMYVQDFN